MSLSSAGYLLSEVLTDTRLSGGYRRSKNSPKAPGGPDSHFRPSLNTASACACAALSLRMRFLWIICHIALKVYDTVHKCTEFEELHKFNADQSILLGTLQEGQYVIILPHRFGSLVAIDKYYFSFCFSLSLKFLLYITLYKVTIWEKEKNVSQKPRVRTVHRSPVPLRDTGCGPPTSRGLFGG